jgi:hypothetical protein
MFDDGITVNINKLDALHIERIEQNSYLYI